MKISFEELRANRGIKYGYLVSNYYLDYLEETDVIIRTKLKEMFPSIELSRYCGQITFTFKDVDDEANFQLYLHSDLEI